MYIALWMKIRYNQYIRIRLAYDVKRERSLFFQSA